MEKYSALIIDLKKSRSYSLNDRNSLQKYILKVIKHLNSLFSHSLVREIEFSAGDEVQGLFISPEASYLYYRLFAMIVYPVEIRAGIGVGEWNVQIIHASTTVQDGPVYHNARHAIKHVKDTQGYPVLLYSGSGNDRYVNTVINSPFAFTDKNTEYQNDMMLMLELLYPIDCSHSIDCSKIAPIFPLLASKKEIDYYTRFRKEKAVRNYPFDVAESTHDSPICTDAAELTSGFFTTSGKKRGMTIQLSRMLLVSRQSVDKTIKTANVYEARNCTITALQFMNKYL